MKTLFTFLLLSVFSLNLMAQDRDLNSVMKERNEFYFSFEINDLQSLEKREIWHTFFLRKFFFLKWQR